MCDVKAAISGGAALIGGIASGSKKKGGTTTETQSRTPWAPQGAALETAFGRAEDNYQATMGLPSWAASNPSTAPVNATQREAAGTVADYARGGGASIAGQASHNAGVLIGASGDFRNNAGALAQNGTGAPNATAVGVLDQAASGGVLGTAGVAGSAGLSGQTGALSTAQTLAQRGQGDLNPAIRAAASGYVNDPLVSGQIDAATRDVARNLGEEVLPGLNASATAGGNLNSARAGAAEAVARRGAEDRAADIAVGVRNNAYNTGISAALEANGQQTQLALGGNAQAIQAGGALSGLGENQRQFDVGTRVDAAGQLGALDQQARSLDAQTRLGANAQLGQAAGMGFDAAAAAGGLVDANGQRLALQGDVQQQAAQIDLENARTAYYADEERRKGALGDYYGIIGANSWGGTTEGTSTAPSTPANPIGGALGGAMAGYGLYRGGAFSGLFGSGSKGSASTGKPSALAG